MGNTANRHNLEINKDWDLAWHIINDTDTNLFLTGKAGTGKTTFLRYLKDNTDKRLVVLAPTGIAAINAHGVTIHSFFQLPFSPFIPEMTTETKSRYRFSKEKLKIIRAADLIVIDEISMVRADLLDAIDDSLRRIRHNNIPFGGVQLLLIGDLQQLAPVVKDNEWELLGKYYGSPYFFDSIALGKTPYVTVELKKVFRQDDGHFINILNRIRSNDADQTVIDELNKRYIPNFKPRREDGYIQLTTHNALAQAINERELSAINENSFFFDAKVEGNFPELSYPTDKRLTLKRGAQIMFVKNDTSEQHLYYNGMIGEIIAINNNGFTVRSKDSGTNIEVVPEKWQNCKYSIDEQTKEIVEEVEGVFMQYPVKLAWAITIHKSQGLTFSKAIIDVHGSFAHGQTYVALSRCKTLEGIVLSSPIQSSAIICDEKINGFTENMLSKRVEKADLDMMHKKYLLHLITSLFDFTSIFISLGSLQRLLDEHLYRAYPRLLDEYKKEYGDFEEKVVKVSLAFKQQYERMLNDSNDGISSYLQERITKGAKYFLQMLLPLKQLYAKTDIPTNNKQISKQAENAKGNLYDAMKMKTCLLEFAAGNPLTSEGILQAKADFMLGGETKVKRERKQKKEALSTMSDVNAHPVLLAELIKWRTEKMKEENMPAYCILTQKAVVGISNLLPTDCEMLMQIPGIGKAKTDKYGEELIGIVKRFLKEQK